MYGWITGRNIRTRRISASIDILNFLLGACWLQSDGEYHVSQQLKPSLSLTSFKPALSLGVVEAL